MEKGKFSTLSCLLGIVIAGQNFEAGDMGAQPIRCTGLPLRLGGATGDKGRAAYNSQEKQAKKKKLLRGIRLSKRSCDYSSEVGAGAFFPHC